MAFKVFVFKHDLHHLSQFLGIQVVYTWLRVRSALVFVAAFLTLFLYYLAVLAFFHDLLEFLDVEEVLPRALSGEKRGRLRTRAHFIVVERRPTLHWLYVRAQLT